MDFFEAIRPALESLLAVILTTVFSYIGLEVKRLYKRYADTVEKQEVIQSTVKYVEQVFKTLEGPEKLQKAIDAASAQLTQKGIAVEASELRTLIEAAVHGLKAGTGKDEDKPATRPLYGA